MSLFSTIKRALGLERVAVSQDPEGPVQLTPAAHAALSALPDDKAMALSLLPTDGGSLVQVTEVVRAQHEPHPAFDGLPVLATEEVVQRLQGLTLDVSDDRWQVRAKVSVRARETPNPNGRMYVLDRPLSSSRLTFGPGSTTSSHLVRRLLDRDDVHTLMIRDRMLTVERTHEAPWDPIDHAVAAAVREHVLLCGGLLADQGASRRDDPLEQAVQEILDARVRPSLNADGGDLELVSVEDGVVKVHLVGACRTCPASTLTMKGAVERALIDAFPGEIDRVDAV